VTIPLEAGPQGVNRRFPAEDHEQVLHLVVHRLSEARLLVGVDDRLHRAAIVDFDRGCEGPLREPVTGRILVALVSRPRAHQNDPDSGGDREPAPARQPAEGDERRKRDQGEDG
jgi:hypothetical protein